jgi:hypothetical protein
MGTGPSVYRFVLRCTGEWQLRLAGMLKEEHDLRTEARVRLG